MAVILFAVVVIYVAIQYSSSYHQKKKANIQITLQKRQLEELLSFKEGLTHMIAHDMKNSLNTIIGLSEGMKSEKMRNIGHAGRLMLNLVTNMLDVQKFQDARIKLTKETVLVKDLFEDAHAQVVLLMQTKSLRFESYVSDSLEVSVDKDIVVRVLVNLLTNAIKYSPNGRTIILKAQVSGIPDKPTAVLSVVDQGSGISKDKLPHIFDKYWQDNAGSSGKAASTGLGLTFAKLAIQSHKGKIAVVSQEEWGTSVNIHLPLPKDYFHVETSEPQDTALSNELILNTELEKIKPYAPRLRELEVYEIGAINIILSEMVKERIKSPWLSDLKASVYQGNANDYQKLLNKLDTPIVINN